MLTRVLFRTTTAFLLVVSLLSDPSLSQQAAMFRGDLEHSGVYRAAGVPEFARIKWKFHTGGQVISSPAVANGVVYVGSTDHNFYAVDLQDGTLKWKFETKSRITSSPAVSGGSVYFGSYDGNFYALDADTGKLKWTFANSGERRFAAKHIHGSQPAGETMPDPFDVYLSSPAVWRETVYFGSGDGNVYAIDVDSGKLRWKFHTGDVVHASPAISEGKLFIGSWDTYFYALDAVSGREIWRFKTGEDPDIHNQVGIQSSALVAGGIVYFGCRDSNFYALDANTGEKRWSFSNHGSWVIGSPTPQKGKVYFATSGSGLFHALDAKSGVPIFSLKLVWPMFSSPSIAGNTLFIGSGAGKLTAIDLVSQRIAWTFETDGFRENSAKYIKADGSPNYEAAFADDFYDDVVIGVEKMRTLGAILSSPVVVDNVVYFGSTDGNLYALM